MERTHWEVEAEPDTDEKEHISAESIDPVVHMTLLYFFLCCNHPGLVVKMRTEWAPLRDQVRDFQTKTIRQIFTGVNHDVEVRNMLLPDRKFYLETQKNIVKVYSGISAMKQSKGAGIAKAKTKYYQQIIATRLKQATFDVWMESTVERLLMWIPASFATKTNDAEGDLDVSDKDDADGIELEVDSLEEAPIAKAKKTGKGGRGKTVAKGRGRTRQPSRPPITDTPRSASESEATSAKTTAAQRPRGKKGRRTTTLRSSTAGASQRGPRQASLQVDDVTNEDEVTENTPAEALVDVVMTEV